MKKHAADYWILIFAIGLTAFGIVMILSASYYSLKDSASGPYYYATSQLKHALLGLGLMFVMWKIPYHWLKKASWIAYLFGLTLLILVLVIGTNVYGAQRWLIIAGVSVQPSDIAKLALVITVASIFCEERNLPQDKLLKKPKLKYKINCFRYLALASLLLVAYCLLIMLQPNLSTTLCIALIFIVMLFTAGIEWKWLLAAGIIVIGAGVILMIKEPYRLQRFDAYIDPWGDPLGSGYQLIQSLYAIGAGGFTGVGLGQSMQKYLYIPFAESDFILAIIAEETGFIGCCLLLLAFVILIWRCTLVAQRSRDPFAILLASGISAMIAIQTIINVCVVTGAIPPTGIPLPFISYGGSSICVMLAAIGIMLNISNYTVLPPPRNMFTFKFNKHGIWHN